MSRTRAYKVTWTYPALDTCFNFQLGRHGGTTVVETRRSKADVGYRLSNAITTGCNIAMALNQVFRWRKFAPHLAQDDKNFNQKKQRF